MKIKITYKNTPMYKFDQKLIDVLEKSGFNFTGSGYNFDSEIRDIGFELEKDGKKEKESTTDS